MTLTIQLPPEIEASLLAQAREEGLTFQITCKISFVGKFWRRHPLIFLGRRTSFLPNRDVKISRLGLRAMRAIQ